MHNQILDATNLWGKMCPAFSFEAFSTVHALTHPTSLTHTVLNPSILAPFLKFWA